MSDNSFGTTFGPSAPGAINVVSGDTGGVDTAHQANNPSSRRRPRPNADITPDGHGGYSLTSDAQPFWDDCSTRDAVALTGTNIGDELNAAGISWGWFQGGFRPTTTFATGSGPDRPRPGQTTARSSPTSSPAGKFAGRASGCPAPRTRRSATPSTPSACSASAATRPARRRPTNSATRTTTSPTTSRSSTTRRRRTRTTWASTTGRRPPRAEQPLERSAPTRSRSPAPTATGRSSTPPNHNYDTSDFDALVAAITPGKLPPTALPAVTFLKAPGYQDGHAAYSEPADEQAFVVDEVNALEQTPDWSSTAVIVNYDDSDGWYDHVYSGVTNPSQSGADNLTGTCSGRSRPRTRPPGSAASPATPLGGEQGRCGFGPRLPMLLISPCAARTRSITT